MLLPIKRLTGCLTLACSLLSSGVVLAQREAAPPAAAQRPGEADTGSWTTLEESWMIIEIGGSRIGWMNSLTEQSGDRIRTKTLSNMTIDRGDAPVAIITDSTFLETADGKPISVRHVMDMAANAVETNWEFAGDKIKQTTRQSGRTASKDFDAPTVEWMTPWAAGKYAKAQREANAPEFKVLTLDPQAGIKPITTTSKRAGDAEYEIDGVKSPVQVWKTISEINPIEATEYVNAEGDVVYQEIPTGIGKIVMRHATKAQAMAEIKHGEGAGAPEIMLKSFARPDKTIENSFKSTTLKLRLTAKEGALPELPSAGAQRVEMAADRKNAVLTIDVNDSLPASEAERSDKSFTETSTMVDFDDALVSKLAARVKDQDDPLEKSDALRKVVYRHISKKNMATAFASASETARTQTGDCSEHGVLLAAMLRSQGIPSRVALGLIYAPEFMGEQGVFGWHMWTQALIDGKWIDFDATLPVKYCASHILTGTSSLADGMGATEMSAILQLLGNINVEVLDVGYSE